MQVMRIITITIAFSLLICIRGIGAQEMSLLKNGDFEGNFLTLDGEPLRIVAEGWHPWHQENPAKPRWQNRQPTYRRSDAAEDGWVKTGEAAQLIASYYETHDAGLYQVVQSGILPGMHLEFSAYARVWSNSYAGRDSSEDAGTIFIQIGVDPTGGRDPQNEAIVWSPPVKHYDEYHQHRVKATAQGKTVTVFLRSWVLKPVAYSEIRWDAAELRILRVGVPLRFRNPNNRHGGRPWLPVGILTTDA